MTKMKKILALIAIILMVACMSTQVFAAGDGKITITNAIAEQEYNAYRIFDLESFSGENYSYTVNPDWATFIASEEVTDVYVTLTDGYVTWVENADPAEFAKLALEYAKTNSISPIATKAATSETVEMTGLDLGYYLVDSTVGTLCRLTTTAKEVSITDKNEAPVIENKVAVTTDTYDVKNTANIGDELNYKTSINAQVGAEGYVLANTYSTGITYEEVTEVKIGDTVVDPTNYTVTPTTNGFTVEFKQEFLDTLETDTVIDVYHKATLNENAVIAGVGNTSTATLTWGEKDTKTASSVATTYTYEFDLVKTDNESVMLTGATFKLYDAETEGNEIAVVKVSDGVYRVATAGETGVAIEAGIATIQGLGNGTYYLEEVTPPEGYNKLNNRQAVTISDGNKKSTTSTDADVTTYVEGGVNVINKTGVELPTTGGMGTTILYIVGSILMVGAGVIFIAKKKMSKAQN